MDTFLLMHIIDLLFYSWKTFDVKFGRYLDPFSISIDIRRSQRSRYGSYFAIDSVRLHNCEPGTYQEITKGQLISKAIYGLLISTKIRTDEFVLFAFLLSTENKSNSSVCFLGESMARRSAFRFYLTFMLNFPEICNMIKLSHINSVILVSLFPLICPIFSCSYLFSNPFTIYDYPQCLW